MEVVAGRMRDLRTKFGLSQARLSKMLQITQSALNRYENNEVAIPDSALLKYADFFDVSLDYIFGRCDEPQGKMFEFKPDVVKMTSEKKEDWDSFVEACFEQGSPLNDRLKEMMLSMAGGEH